jgi:hypothetical protein
MGKMSFGQLLDIFGRHPGPQFKDEKPIIYTIHDGTGIISKSTGWIVKDPTLKEADNYLLGGAIDKLHSWAKYSHNAIDPLLDLGEHLDPELKKKYRKPKETAKPATSVDSKDDTEPTVSKPRDSSASSPSPSPPLQQTPVKPVAHTDRLHLSPVPNRGVAHKTGSSAFHVRSKEIHRFNHRAF